MRTLRSDSTPEQVRVNDELGAEIERAFTGTSPALMQPICSRGCRLVPIPADLWLCDHAAYGGMVDLKGAVEQARWMLERSGGYSQLRDALDRLALERKKQRQSDRDEGVRRVRHAVRER